MPKILGKKILRILRRNFLFIQTCEVPYKFATDLNFVASYSLHAG